MSDRYLVSSQDGRMVVEFDWNVDRFSHRLSIDGVVVGNSIEGDCDAVWPTSPPIQQLSLEVINGQRMVLGVGGAGRSHWSISAGPSQDQAGAIQFDLACRCKAAAEFLGSTYRVTSPLTLAVFVGEMKRENGSEIISPLASGGVTRQWSYRFSESPQALQTP